MNATETTNGSRPEKGAPGQEGTRRNEVTLVDLLVAVARNLSLIAYVTVALTIMGLAYSILAPHEYTSQARVIREAQSDAPPSLSGSLSALQGFGINFGGASSGLTPDAYPSIMKSREVRLAVARDTFYFNDVEREMSFIEYQALQGGVFGQVLTGLQDYTIGLIGRLIDGRSATETSQTGGLVPQLEEKEEKAIQAIEGMVGVSVDPETGIMSISVTAPESKLAAAMAQRSIDHLSERVRGILTEKARQNLSFIRNRFEEAANELQTAEARLTTFVDRNQSIQSAALRTEQDRLERQVRFKSNLYSELQARVSQAEIDLKKSEPVITVIEAPIAPLQRSAPQRTLIVMASFIFGLVLGTSAGIARFFFIGGASQEQREKIEEVKRALVPSRVTAAWERARRSLHSDTEP